MDDPGSFRTPTRVLTTQLGAYGLGLRGVPLPSDLLVRCDDSWPAVELVLREAPAAPIATGSVDSDHLVLRLGEASAIAFDRRSRRVEFITSMPLSPEELAHPYLAPVATVVSRWLDRLSFHGGGFVAGGGVWGVLGEKEAGKSSLLGWLVRHGYEVMADDLLAVEGASVFAGPRCLDLRSDPARHLQVDECLSAGIRERWRLRLGPVAPSAPLTGWVFLAWGETVDLVPLSPSQRLVRLADSLSLVRAPAHPEHLLRLAGLPGWELRRPPAWNSMKEAADRLIEIISG